MWLSAEGCAFFRKKRVYCINFRFGHSFATMSSFKRKVKPEETEVGQSVQNSVKNVELSISGVKPWVNTGLGIVSTGLRQLDELLGGGLPLGTTVLHMNDSYSGFGQSIVGYCCAESISHAQNTAILSMRAEDALAFRSSLPFNRHLDPEPEPEKEPAPSFGLTIAWQYEKYISKHYKTIHDLIWIHLRYYINIVSAEAKQIAVPRTIKSGSLQFCCSYDLSKR